MLRKLAFSLMATACSFSTWAQTTDTAKAAAPAPVLAITGSVDVFYRYDFNKNKDPNTSSLTSFARAHDQFALGMASVKLEHKTAKLDMVADLGFGPRAQEFAYNDAGIVQAIKQLYISYSPSAAVKFTAGTWATHIGYEVLDAYLNRNYSMSYMFTNGPFSHTGVKADFTFGKSGFMIGVSNPTDFRSVPSSLENNKNLIAQYSFAPSDNLHLYLNYVGGRDATDAKIHQYDLVLTAKASSLFSLGVNGTVNKSSYPGDNYATGHTWYGGALYLNLDPQPWFGLTLRSEYFSDKDGIKLHPVSAATGAKVFANTLSALFKVDGFTFIPEFRYDHGSEELWTKKDGTTTKSGASVVVAAIYSF